MENVIHPKQALVGILLYGFDLARKQRISQNKQDPSPKEEKKEVFSLS